MITNQLVIKCVVFDLFFVIDDGKELEYFEHGNGKLCLLVR